MYDKANVDNMLHANYSAILGGCNNNDNGFNYAGIFGCNINNAAAMAPKTFHVNCLNACDTPNIAIAPPPGTVSFYLVTGAWPAGITAGMKVLVLA